MHFITNTYLCSVSPSSKCDRGCTVGWTCQYICTVTCVGDGSVGVTCRLVGADCLCGTCGNVAEAACTTFKACWGIWTTWDSGLDWTSWTCCTTAGCPGLCTIRRLLPACKHRGGGDKSHPLMRHNRDLVCQDQRLWWWSQVFPYLAVETIL